MAGRWQSSGREPAVPACRLTEPPLAREALRVTERAHNPHPCIRQLPCLRVHHVAAVVGVSSSLRRQLREALPAHVKGLPRAVALEIADDARWDDGWRYSPESGRRSKATLSDLVRWTAAKNERVIRDALRNLALAGWEFRVPFGKGADGRLLYAVPGRAAEFRVPDFEPPTVDGPAESKETVTTVSSSQAVVAAKETVTTAAETVTTAKETVTTAYEAVTTGPPSPVSSSPKESPTSSSVAELSATEPADPPNDGGGGGDLSSRFTAQEITAALDYRGKQPDKRQRQTITDRLAAALDSGWTVDGLALYLDLGAAAVDSPAAVYAHRLKPGVLPDAEPVPPQVRRGGVRGELPSAEEYEALTVEDVLGPARPATGVAAQWREASRRAQDRLTGSGGTDSTVAGWAAVSRQLAAKEPRRPYNNDAWSQPAIAAEMAAIPHCEDSVCDPKTRLRDYEGEDGLKYCSPCEKCHPRMQWG